MGFSLSIKVFYFYNSLFDGGAGTPPNACTISNPLQKAEHPHAPALTALNIQEPQIILQYEPDNSQKLFWEGWAAGSNPLTCKEQPGWSSPTPSTSTRGI